MTLVKICGITNMRDAESACRLNVDMLGFVFYDRSKRYIDAKRARAIIDKIPESVLKVGVFVNEEKSAVSLIAAEAGLDALQFHGDESPEYCSSFRCDYRVIKAFRLRDRNSLVTVNSYDTDMYLLDTYVPGDPGGTGESFDWSLLKEFEFLRPFILSGGLNAGNVKSAIAEVAPYGVDVSTGVEESAGKKSAQLMKKFVEEVRKS